MKVPSNARGFWFYSNASIPANWSEDGDYTQNYLQGVSDDTRTTGGATGHAHPWSGHTHTGNQHRHQFSAAINEISPSNQIKTQVRPGQSLPGSPVFHDHTTVFSPYATVTYQNANGTTVSGTANPPARRAVIIGPDDANQDIPQKVGFGFDLTAIPASFALSDGTGITVDMDGRYVLGATAGGDGGATLGSTNHSHTGMTIHGHTPDNHSHSSIQCGVSSTQYNPVVNPQTTAMLDSAHHDVALQSGSAGATSTDQPGATDTITNDPASMRLHCIQQTNAVDQGVPTGAIWAYKGTIASIPADWQLADGSGSSYDCRDRWIKFTTTGGEVGTTIGSNTHQHTTASTHNHTHTGSHNHTASAGVQSTFNRKPNTLFLSSGSHSHAWTVTTQTPTMQAANITTTAVDIRKPYRRLIWIRYNGPSAAVGIGPIMRGIIPV